MSNLTRRDFMLSTGLLLLFGKDCLNNYYDKKDEEIIHKIYNKYPQKLHETVTNTKLRNSDILMSKGSGIIVDDKYITAAHVVDNTITEQRTPFGIQSMLNDVVNQTTTLYDVPLENVYLNNEDDVAVFNLSPEQYNLNGFTIDDCCFEEPQLGETIYIIGNPALQGMNIRRGYVSDLDGLKLHNNNPAFFGIDKPLVPGDSGGIIVNKKGRLKGINSQVLSGALGYAVKLKEFERWLQ